jgi:RHS repeat-associated protein
VALEYHNGSLTTRHLHGPGIDQVLASELVATQEVRWAMTDHLGSVRDVIDSGASILNHLSYDSFGNITNESNPSVEFAFSYAGREYEASIGLYYNRARWYDARTGTFISVDPIREGVNWYAYVGNGPLTATDPSGLESFENRIARQEYRERMERRVEARAQSPRPAKPPEPPGFFTILGQIAMGPWAEPTQWQREEMLRRDALLSPSERQRLEDQYLQNLHNLNRLPGICIPEAEIAQSNLVPDKMGDKARQDAREAIKITAEIAALPFLVGSLGSAANALAGAGGGGVGPTIAIGGSGEAALVSTGTISTGQVAAVGVTTGAAFGCGCVLGREIQVILQGAPDPNHGPNPYGSPGKPDHRQATEELVDEFGKKYPKRDGFEIRSNQSIKNETGINRRPDAAAVKDGQVHEVGEVARTNKDGSLVPREALKQKEYEAAGLPSTVKKIPK